VRSSLLGGYVVPKLVTATDGEKLLDGDGM
jgi:hypothetical protein